MILVNHFWVNYLLKATVHPPKIYDDISVIYLPFPNSYAKQFLRNMLTTDFFIMKVNENQGCQAS